MSKTIKALVHNSAGNVINTVDLVQGAGAKGTPVRLKAVPGVRYMLQDTAAAAETGPASVYTKRVKKNLHVMLEGSTAPDLIIEDYYDAAVVADGTTGLYGRASDGNLYEYVSERSNDVLVDGGAPVCQVLGGEPVSSEAFGLTALPVVAAAGGLSGGALAGLGALGLAALGGGGGGGSGSGSGSTPDTTPPNAPKAPVVDKLINATEAKAGVKVVVDLAGTNAVEGDKITVTVDKDSSTKYTLTAADIKAGKASVTVGTAVLQAAGEGAAIVSTTITDAAGNTSQPSAATPITIDTMQPVLTGITIPDAQKDGIINVADVGDGGSIVNVSFVKATEGDIISISLGTTGQKVFYSLRAEDVKLGMASITLGKAVLEKAAGTYDLVVLINDPANNWINTGAVTKQKITVDAVAPGAPKITVSEAGDQIINATEAADGTVVQVTNLKEINAKAGDTITVKVDNIATQYKLTATDITAGKASVTVSNAMLKVAGEGNAQLTVTLTDSVGNVSPTSSIVRFNIDTVAPTPLVTFDKTSIVAGQTSTVTFSFSEAVKTFDLTDVKVSGGGLSEFKQDATNPLKYTAKFTAGSAAAIAQVEVLANGYTDAAGNNGKAATAAAIVASPGTDTQSVVNKLVLDIIENSTKHIVLSAKDPLTGETAKIPFTDVRIEHDFTYATEFATGLTLDNKGQVKVQLNGSASDFKALAGATVHLYRVDQVIDGNGKVTTKNVKVASKAIAGNETSLAFDWVDGNTLASTNYFTEVVKDQGTYTCVNGATRVTQRVGHTTVAGVNKSLRDLVDDLNGAINFYNGTLGALLPKIPLFKYTDFSADFTPIINFVDTNKSWTGGQHTGFFGNKFGIPYSWLDVITEQSYNPAASDVISDPAQSAADVAQLDAALHDAAGAVAHQEVTLDFTKATAPVTNFADGKAQVVTINAKDLLAYTHDHGALQITGDAFDEVHLVNEGTALTIPGQSTINGQVFNTYDLNHDGVNDLLILQAMNVAQLS